MRNLLKLSLSIVMALMVSGQVMASEEECGDLFSGLKLSQYQIQNLGNLEMLTLNALVPLKRLEDIDNRSNSDLGRDLARSSEREEILRTITQDLKPIFGSLDRLRADKNFSQYDLRPLERVLSLLAEFVDSFHLARLIAEFHESRIESRRMNAEEMRLTLASALANLNAFRFNVRIAKHIPLSEKKTMESSELIERLEQIRADYHQEKSSLAIYKAEAALDSLLELLADKKLTLVIDSDEVTQVLKYVDSFDLQLEKDFRAPHLIAKIFNSGATPIATQEKLGSQITTLKNKINGKLY